MKPPIAKKRISHVENLKSRRWYWFRFRLDADCGCETCYAQFHRLERDDQRREIVLVVIDIYGRQHGIPWRWIAETWLIPDPE